jgi:hypothetical protein
MSESVTLFYALPPLRRSSRNILDDVNRQHDLFRDRAIELCQRLDEHGVEDGYEISMPNNEVMKVVAFTPACALLLKCWGGYLPQQSEPPPIHA